MHFTVLGWQILYMYIAVDVYVPGFIENKYFLQHVLSTSFL